MKVRTRFAPSPTGHLHVGNARTALFCALLAGRAGGEFVLRIEDTDAGRSRPEFEAGLLADLAWLGLRWQEGPDLGGPRAPYRQSERGDIYRTQLDKLAAARLTYPCFCTPAELALARKLQLAAGKPPRYAGTCAHLTADEVRARIAQGLKPALRFRVPDSGATTFDDLVRGTQQFAHKDIGDFVIQRADGSPAFFFSNAVDDALMGITHVLRGEDHLANTPRQILLLQALNLPLPQYGHLSLIVGEGGAPLSKREGGGSLRELRAAGVLPGALTNYLARLGHTYSSNEFMTFNDLAREFRVEHIGHAPAHYDRNHLRHWQKLAIASATDSELWNWMKSATSGAFVEGSDKETVESIVPADKRMLFVQAVRPNVLGSMEIKPDYDSSVDTWYWACTFFRDYDFMLDAGRDAISRAGADYFRNAEATLCKNPDYGSFAKALAVATGLRGAALYMPLRAALTGDVHGPELKLVWMLLGPERIGQRLSEAAEIAGNKS